LQQCIGFPLVQQLGNPSRLAGRVALAVEQIDRAIELQQNASKGFQFTDEVCLQRKGQRRSPPVLIGEKSSGRKSGLNVSRAFEEVCGSRRVHVGGDQKGRSDKAPALFPPAPEPGPEEGRSHRVEVAKMPVNTD
jgi:hypothetical protein